MFSRLASFLALQGHQVRVLVLHGGETFFPLPSTVELQRCPVAGGAAMARFYRRQMWLRRQLREFAPDLVLSFIEVANVHALLAAPPRVPVIVSERTDPRWHRPPAVYRALRGLVYGRAAHVLVQSEGLRSWAERRWKHGAAAVMPNPVFPAPPAPPLDRSPRVVSFGRLSEEKSYGDLLKAFAGVAPTFPEWQVVIFGEGPQRPRLLGLVQRLHLQGRALLPGAVPDPAAQLRRGDVFALTSRYEGFPNALAEAMARGVAVVAYDCPSGPRELIRSGVDGVLVPSGDLQALAEALRRLMESEQDRLRLGERAREILQRFPADEILARWETLCQRVALGATGRPPAR
ncbi:MAG: glycosyltransferase [Acidobacteriota bacterium]